MCVHSFYMYIYTYLFTFKNVFIHIYIIYIYISYFFSYFHICLFTHIYVFRCVFISIQICIHVCMYRFPWPPQVWGRHQRGRILWRKGAAAHTLVVSIGYQRTRGRTYCWIWMGNHFIFIRIHFRYSCCEDMRHAATKWRKKIRVSMGDFARWTHPKGRFINPYRSIV